MKKFLLLAVIIAIFILQPNTVNAQIYRFQHYGIERGLCHHVVHSIVQDRNGFIWFATGLGLCRFDGFRFSSPDSDILPVANVNTSFKDNDGNLWFGYNNGLTVKYDGINFSIADTSVTKTAVAQIIQAPDGEILIATQTGGIARIFNNRIDRIEESFSSVMISAMCFAGNDRLLVGSFNGLYLFNYGAELQNLTLLASNEEMAHFTVTSITPKNNGNGFWVTTDFDGVYHVVIDGNRFITTQLDIPEIDYAQVQSLYEDMHGNLWISTFGTGLLHVRLSENMQIYKTTVYNNDTGLGSDNVKQAFFDNRQNLWVATFGRGVASITNRAFSFFVNLEPVAANATAVYSTDDSEYWIAGVGAIIRITILPEYRRTIFGRADGLPNDRITALRADDAGNMWIGTERSGLYRLDKNTQRISLFYREANLLANSIQNFVFSDGKIWIATRGGVLVVDKQTGEKNDHFTTFDGGLPHNDIKDIFKDSKNRIWIATLSNSLVDVKTNNRLFLLHEMELADFSTITEDEQGRIWAGTIGRGVYVFDEAQDTVFQITSNEGLMSNFCYAISLDNNGQIWIGHRLGISRINTQNFAVNTFGIEKGILGDVNPLAMILNESGEMLIGMTDGVMMYNSRDDITQSQIPMLNIVRVLINDIPHDPFTSITLPFGRYKVQFEFIGLNYSDPGSVLYQYWLDGYDLEWTSFSRFNIALYPRLESGVYKFWVRACYNNNFTDDILLFTITIRKPFWKTWWFISLAILSIIGIIYIIIIVRERRYIKFQEFLEKELKERTKEVRKQRDEIEIKNKDITDSINYAQRIQVSVLPSINMLLEHCSGAFVFHRPRDIVSGDFYWFDYFPESHRLIIFCADSTGHGVPGAFMSLIGTTLIKDITMRPDVLDPADILYALDEKIHSTLNQNRDSEQANDGMDLTVCEINTETYLVKVSSAMRPFMIYQNGVCNIYKGSRASIGGQFLENKVFETKEIQLSKGDVIYMFTDGYPDQFGGPAGKRMKMNRLQNIINDVCARNMKEQHRVIKENFDLWKGKNEQLDDVLMVGVML